MIDPPQENFVPLLLAVIINICHGHEFGLALMPPIIFIPLVIGLCWENPQTFKYIYILFLINTIQNRPYVQIPLKPNF